MKEFKVIKIQNENEIVINGGENEGITIDSVFLIYKKGEELFDPDTNKSLGFLEIVCGKAKVKHLQDRMATLESCKKETTYSTKIIKREGAFIFNNTSEEIKEPSTRVVPFEDVDLSCIARLL